MNPYDVTLYNAPDDDPSGLDLDPDPASLCSPFLPQAYAAFPPLWLLTLLAATYAPTKKVLFLVLVAWLGLASSGAGLAMDRRLLAGSRVAAIADGRLACSACGALPVGQ